MKRFIPFLVGAALLVPLTSSAATFDAMCAPETEHNPGLLSPNLAFMLDKSGSMGQDSSEAGKSKWDAAKEALNETVQAFTTPGACSVVGDPNCDKVRFGIGLFDTNASFPVDVGEDTVADIAQALTDNNPGNYTAMGLAAEALENSTTLQDATRSNHAVFITDGLPEDGSETAAGNTDTLVGAVLALCRTSTRAVPLTTSVIGFGGGTDIDTISLLAAAGGTGSCCTTAACATPILVCNLSESELISHLRVVDDIPSPNPNLLVCTGGIDITSNTGLKDAISTIVAEAACTFPLDIPAFYPDGAAQEDTDFTRVELNHGVYGPVVVDNIGEDCEAPSGIPTALPSPDYDNEGWCFVQNRKSIRVTGKLCADIGASDIETVVTQVACICELTGQPCALTDVMCKGQACTNEQLLNMPCSAGKYICDEGIDVCAPTGNGRLPEICNGVDDNCDGLVDNLGESEAEWDEPEFASFKDNTALHCEFENVCGCEGGAKAPVTVNGGVNQLIADAIPECVCKAALEFEESSVNESSANQEESDNSQDNAAACSALSNDPTGLLYLLLPIGLVGFIRRRRRA